MNYKIIDFNPETLSKKVINFFFSFDYNNHCWFLKMKVDYFGKKQYDNERFVTETPSNFISRYIENVEPERGYYRTIKMVKA